MCVHFYSCLSGSESILNLLDKVILLKFWHVVNGIYLCVLMAPVNSFHERHLTQGYTPSWEYFITLDLEWAVIRGRRLHGWSFWVRNDKPFLIQMLPGGQRAEFPWFIDIFLCPLCNPRVGGHKSRYSQHCGDNQLSGTYVDMWSILHLSTNPRGLVCHSKVTVLLIMVSSHFPGPGG